MFVSVVPSLLSSVGEGIKTLHSSWYNYSYMYANLMDPLPFKCKIHTTKGMLSPLVSRACWGPCAIWKPFFAWPLDQSHIVQCTHKHQPILPFSVRVNSDFSSLRKEEVHLPVWVHKNSFILMYSFVIFALCQWS